jgi:hypothetical protein
MSELGHFRQFATLSTRPACPLHSDRSLAVPLSPTAAIEVCVPVFRSFASALIGTECLRPRSSAGTDGNRVVASRADEYRRRARECLEMARTFGDRDARVLLSHMAQAWLRLADTIGPEQKQRIGQQQQQIQPDDNRKA